MVAIEQIERWRGGGARGVGVTNHSVQCHAKLRSVFRINGNKGVEGTIAVLETVDRVRVGELCVRGIEREDWV